jgi:hypothetical protein
MILETLKFREWIRGLGSKNIIDRLSRLRLFCPE